MSLRVVSAGPGATIQDGGRIGYLRYGVVASGPMDFLAFEIANRALENPAGAACIEISLGGIEVICVTEPIRLAFAGGGFSWQRDGTRLPSAAVVTLAPGERLSVKPGRWGTWCYLAIEGGFDVPLVLGSRSTYARFAIGGLDGRALRADDVIPSVAPQARSRGTAANEESAIISPLLDRCDDRIRVVLGPQDDYFTPEALATFFEGTYAISPRCDRMGYWLEGPRLAHLSGFDIVSDGIPLGAIQVPGEGRPLILMADHQATGGYPKLGTVIRADIGAVAQHRPGDSLRFVRCSVDAARRALLELYAALVRPLVLEPLGAELRSEDLLARNLIGGVTDGS